MMASLSVSNVAIVVFTGFCFGLGFAFAQWLIGKIFK